MININHNSLHELYTGLKNENIMKLHLLLTSDIAQTKPETCKIVMDFGQLVVMFDEEETRTGLHCVVEDTQENIVNCLKSYDSFVKGSGVPQFEQFSIAHVK